MPGAPCRAASCRAPGNRLVGRVLFANPHVRYTMQLWWSRERGGRAIRMPEHTPAPRPDDEREITDLHPRRVPPNGARQILVSRTWRRVALGLAFAVLLALLLTSLRPGSPLQWLGGVTRSPSPTASAVALRPVETVSAALPPTPASPLMAPTPVPGVSGVPTLGTAPTSCSAEPPALTNDFPPQEQAIGDSPVLLGGFIGPYAKLLLGPAASAMAYSWTAPYSTYGWPAPIGLILRGQISGPVTLSGSDLRTGHPLWFGFVVAGDWGPPTQVVSRFVLDPAHPSPPAGGWTDTETFWYGYAFLPGAGCYMLDATWPDGSWHIMVSAGR
jgi:hypothetical protein